MAKKRSTAAASALGSRAWRRLRLAVVWIRKGGAFKHGALLFDLRVLPSCVKSLKPSRRADRLYYGEREFSFDKTPLFQFRPRSMRLPRIPCITPADGAFFSDEDDGDVFFRSEYSAKNNEVPAATGAAQWKDEVHGYEEGSLSGIYGESDEDEGIDLKAEEFITRFYEQMRLQRQLSLLRYNV